MSHIIKRKQNGAQTEYFEDVSVIDQKAKEFVELLQSAKHVVVHTGAGVSTATGIPDFRGPNGVWTLEDIGKSPFESNSQRSKISNNKNNNNNDDTNANHIPGYMDVLPTPTHMALAAWYHAGILKYLITQNVDALHLRSGIPRDHLSELHGNVCLERCPRCKAEYLRTFDAAEDADDHHFTPRYCNALLNENEKCSSRLVDSIVDFGEDLPENDLNEAERHSKEADLTLVLGTSLQVTPACHLPQMTLDNGGKVVVVNLQETYIDKDCSIRVFGKCDEFMLRVMKYLKMDIPGLTIPYNLVVVRELQKIENNNNNSVDNNKHNVNKTNDVYAWCINIEGEARRSLGIFKKIYVTIPSSASLIESSDNENYNHDQLKKTKRKRTKKKKRNSKKNKNDKTATSSKYHPYHCDEKRNENNNRIVRLTEHPFAVMRQSPLPIVLSMECHFQPFLNHPPFRFGYKLAPETEELTTITFSLSLPSIPAS